MLQTFFTNISAKHKMKDIKKIIDESIKVKQTLPIKEIKEACKEISFCYRNNHKLLVCGNGGSAADSQHMAGEMVNKFLMQRRPLPCLALTTDTSVITAISNDSHFKEVFSKQIEAYGKNKDILICISTSGNSLNQIEAAQAARRKGMKVIGILGKDGGTLARLCDYPIIVKSESTPRIQESHILIIHIICELVERDLFT